MRTKRTILFWMMVFFFSCSLAALESPAIAGEPGSPAADSTGIPDEPGTPDSPASAGVPASAGEPAKADAKTDGEKGVLVAENLRYNFAQGEVIAQGNAVLTYRDVTIRGDELLINLEENTLSGQEVTIEKEGASFTGENFLYDFQKDRGSIDNYYSFNWTEDNQPLIIRGEQGEIHGDLTIVQRSSMTGCDREKPHYHLTAKKVEYYPDDKIIFRHVFYWEGPVRLFYLPVMVVSLKEKESNFDQPVVGYNEYDGIYVKLVYRYFMKAGYYGLLMLDWFQYGGLGQGVKQYFPLGGDKDLSFNFYNYNNYRTGGQDIQVGAGWSHKLGPLFDYSLNTEYWQRSTLQWQGSGYGTLEYDEYRFRAVLNGRDRVWPFTINLEGGKRYTYSEYYLYPQVQLTWRPSSQHSVKYSGRLDHRQRPDTGYISTKYIYTLQTSHNIGGYQLRTEIYEAADHSPEPPANWYSLNRLPSVRLTTPVYRWGILGDYRVYLDYLHLVKAPDGLEGHRVDLHLQRTFHTLWQREKFTLQLGSSLRRQDYWLEEGEFSRRAWSIDLRGTTRFTPYLSWENTVSWVESGGSTPATFPQLISNSSYYLPKGNYQTRLYYNAPQIRAELRGGYNMGGTSNPWHVVYANANWELNESNRLVFNTSYNPNTSEFGLVYLTFRYQPDTERNVELDVVYDPTNDIWSTLDLETRFRQRLTRNLEANFDLRYSFFGDGFERARIGLGYDWHCRQLHFGYNVIDREYYLQIWYKVLPEAGFAFGSGQAGFAWPGSG